MSEEKEAAELKDEELGKVVGGNNSNNPLGLIHGDTVVFYNGRYALWMWGQFDYYDGRYYTVTWQATTIYNANSSVFVSAGTESVSEEHLKGSSADVGTSRWPL